MGMTKTTTFQINCDKKDCQVGVVEYAGTREEAAERLTARGWKVLLYPGGEEVLCPRCRS